MRLFKYCSSKVQMYVSSGLCCDWFYDFKNSLLHPLSFSPHFWIYQSWLNLNFVHIVLSAPTPPAEVIETKRGADG